MSKENLPVVSVSVTIAEEGGVYKATFGPSPTVIDTASVLNYSLATEGWAFETVTFSAPFSDLETISPTEFNITDNGGAVDTTDSFSVVIIQTDVHRGAAAQIDSDPEVLNGPHG
jgi:hypothetical protein